MAETKILNLASFEDVETLKQTTKSQGEEISQAKQDILNGIGIAEIPTVVGGYFIGTTVGSKPTLSAYTANWCRTEKPVFVYSGNVIKLKTRGAGFAALAISTDNNFDNAKTAIVASNDNAISEYTYTVEENCYAWVSGRVNETAATVINQNSNFSKEIANVNAKIEGLAEADSQLSETITDISVNNIGIAEIPTVVGGYFIGTTVGSKPTLSAYTANWCRTEKPVFVYSGNVIKLKTRGAGFAALAISTDNNFDNAKTAIVASNDNAISEYTYTVEENCYAWVSGRVNETAATVINQQSKLLQLVSTLIEKQENGKKKYVVGKGGDFESFTQALSTLKDDSSQKTIYIKQGTYNIFDEIGGANFINTIDETTANWRDVNFVVPPNTEIIGQGNVKLEFNPTDEEIKNGKMAFLFSPLNVSGSCRIENIEINCSNCRYAIHDESSGLAIYDDTIHEYVNVRARKKKTTYGLAQVFGSGLGARSRWYFESCEFRSDMDSGFSVHTTASVPEDLATIIFNNCIIETEASSEEIAKKRYTMIFISSNNHKSEKNIVKLNNCYTNGKIKYENNDGSAQKFELKLNNTRFSGFGLSDIITTNPYPPKVY